MRGLRRVRRPPAASPGAGGQAPISLAAPRATDVGDVGDGQTSPASQGNEAGIFWFGVVVVVGVMGVALYAGQLSRQKQASALRQLADEINGEFSDTPAQVQMHVKKWTITLDTWYHSTGKTAASGLRLRAPFVTRDAFRFAIKQKEFLGGLGAGSEMPEIKSGDAELDEAYLIQGTDESKVRALLANPKTRQLIQEQTGQVMEVQDESLPAGVYQLSWSHTGVITDPERLRSLFDLFAETLNQLCVIGSASEAKPDVS